MGDERFSEVAVWLHDDHARLLVGAAPATRPSRWAIQGSIADEIGVGLWLRANTIQEFRPVTSGVKQVTWQFASTELLIRWDAIITIQVFEGGGKEIGFKASGAE
jgi:hypothetical protein